ncbi:MAG TPA: AraC family transcriptional regulator [Microbacterium sp.]|nr:AraC family transcriptional regulator [Microbacterium sp.]
MEWVIVAKTYASVYGDVMDGMTAILDSARANGAFVLRSMLAPPWAMRIEDDAPLTLLAPSRGDAWVVLDDRPPVRLQPGDVALVRGPDLRYTVADPPSTPPQVRIDPLQHPHPVGDEVMAMFGERSWGNDAAGTTVLFSGTYQVRGELSDSLLRVLPPLAVVERCTATQHLMQMLEAEIEGTDPGQDTVLDRLLDLLLIATLRTWFGRTERAPGWFSAYGDPIVGAVLRLMHGDPAHSWTLAELARRSGTSRAALARRFTDLVGQPPMTYLTDWRLKLTADLLRDGELTVGSIAARVGYSTPFALSAAFRRERGISPRDYRRRVLSSADASS